MANKKIYFISDAHLGCRVMRHARTKERRLVRFLDSVKDKADAVYMLGDMFDFWFEYADVVPRGFTRFLGKVSELTDLGVEVHFFVGNHDMWVGDYLQKECGVIIHLEPCTIELYGKEFLLAHGHLIDIKARGGLEKFMLACFLSKPLRRLAKMIHPHWFINFGLNWAKRNHERHQKEGPAIYDENVPEPLVDYSKKYLETHPSINYFIYGHRHIDLDMNLADDSRLIILGEWFSKFTYAVFDGESLIVDHYVEGETQL